MISFHNTCGVSIYRVCGNTASHLAVFFIFLCSNVVMDFLWLRLV